MMCFLCLQLQRGCRSRPPIWTSAIVLPQGEFMRGFNDLPDASIRMNLPIGFLYRHSRALSMMRTLPAFIALGSHRFFNT
jgi:hypothetical protein